MAANTIPAALIAITGITPAEVAELESMESDFFAGARKLISRWEMCCELRAAGVRVDEIRGEPLNAEGHTIEWTRCAWRFDGAPVISIDDILARL